LALKWSFYLPFSGQFLKVFSIPDKPTAQLRFELSLQYAQVFASYFVSSLLCYWLVMNNHRLLS